MQKDADIADVVDTIDIMDAMSGSVAGCVCADEPTMEKIDAEIALACKE